jgi:hypothetical protein
MKTIPELVKLYEEFFKALSAKLNKDDDDPIVDSDEYQNPTDAEIDAFAVQFNVIVPDDIRAFWKSMKSVYAALIEENGEWIVTAGWDFQSLKCYIIRDLPMKRGLAKNYPDGDMGKKLHETGVQLTYEEPILLFDADPKTKEGNIHWVCYDGASLTDVIAPNFRTFFEHWLATGCFQNGNFDTYWEMVKDIVPIQIPAEDNLWLKFYNKQSQL